MVVGVIACVVQILFCFHVLIDMVGFYLQPEAVCVSIDELTLSPVLALKLIALKIVHQYFADIENHHPSIKRLVQFHTLFGHSELTRWLKNSVQPAKRGLTMSLQIFSLSSPQTIVL